MMTTSDTDPYCGMPLANSGSYTNLQPYGLTADPSISGDTILITAFSTGAPINFYGADQTGGLKFVDDGLPI